jgi:fructokinase
MISTNDRPAPSVLVIGESLMDVVRVGDDEYRHPGGSPMNVAYGLARLGVDTRLLTRIGPDSDGDAIRQHLAAAGVTLLDESLDGARTSVSTANIGPDGSASYSFEIDWRLAGFSGLHQAKWIHVGSIATFLPPGADSLERLLQALGNTTSISYDPNIRPSIIGDHAQAIGRFERISRLAKVVKLSDEDAAWLYPSLSEKFVVDKILALGPDMVALTRGAAGARISTRQSTVEIPAPRVEVADTIGAGDSFMAALISALLAMDVRNMAIQQLEHVARLSVMAAALTCTRPGAQPPTLLELIDALPGRANPGRAGAGAIAGPQAPGQGSAVA